MTKGIPQRPKPSLPHLKCLDRNEVDAADAAAGQTVARTFHELAAALDEEFLHEQRCKRDEPDKPRRRRARRRHAKPVPTVEHHDAPAELVPAEALEKPAQVYSHEQPAAVPRARSTPPEHHRIPRKARLVTIDIADPDAEAAAAELVEGPAGSVMNGHGAHHEWQAPRRPTVRVIARADVVGMMHARGQLDQASFHAAREYQKVYEMAELAGMPTVDIGMPRIQTRCIGGDYVGVDGRRRAAAKLHSIEAELAARFGLVGLRLVRDVLGRSLTIEQCTANREDGSDRQSLRFWGSLLRRCLQVLARILGYATAAPDHPWHASPGARP